MGIKVISKNKRAGFDYHLEDKVEVGIVLVGTEVKSLREGKVTISESHISIDGNHEIWIHNMKIAPYAFGNINNHEEARSRKLLMGKMQIEEFAYKMKAERLTIVPTIIYFKGSVVKMEIALAKGKKLYDKRQDQAKKDVERKLRRGED